MNIPSYLSQSEIIDLDYEEQSSLIKKQKYQYCQTVDDPKDQLPYKYRHERNVLRECGRKFTQLQNINIINITSRITKQKSQ